jgi:hypothetical protein
VERVVDGILPGMPGSRGDEMGHYGIPGYFAALGAHFKPCNTATAL